MLTARVRLLSRGPRSFHSAKPVQAEAGFFEADHSTKILSVYHKLNWGLLAITPAAFAFSPSVLNMPIDLALSIAFPLHAHVAMNAVISDYVKKYLGKGAVGPARGVMMGVTGLTAVGLLKCSLTGPGITETIKSLWRKAE